MSLILAAVTDEFSPTDLDRALDAMAEAGMSGVELRMVWGKNVIHLDSSEIDRVMDAVERRGMTVLSIASPVFKCVLPDAPALDPCIQQDQFAASHTFEQQSELAERAFAIARRTGARVIRVFSYWRTVDPDACFARVASALANLADQASRHGLIIGLENEHACNIATGAESARLLAAVAHPALQIIWDPGNALAAGESPFPEGYRQVPVDRIVHVHVKDAYARPGKPEWAELGAGDIDWPGQISALVVDGYRGAISLETHWKGPNGDKFEASQICAKALATLVAQTVRKPQAASRKP
jgi:L-ribulose-5-phosphate 3-epimerase